MREGKEDDLSSEERTSTRLWNEQVNSLMEQWRGMRSRLLLLYAPLVVLFIVVIILRITTGIAIAELTRDPISFSGLPLYTGSISNIGVMIWSGAAAICFFGYGMVRSGFADRRIPQFLLAGGILTTILLVDDFFLFHEEIFPGVGIPQDLVLGIYMVLMIAFVVWFRATILQTRYLLLVLAGFGFGMSILVDVLIHLGLVWPLFLAEDGAKLFGIVNWTAYFTTVSAQFIAERFRSGSGERAPDVAVTGSSSARSHTP